MTEKNPPDQILQAPFLDSKAEIFAPTLIQRAQLIWQHAYAAALFSRMVGEMEAAHQGKRLGSFFDDIYAHASPCIIMAAAGVEAYANQIFADRALIFAHFDKQLLEGMWEKWAERQLSPLEKFRFAFQLKGLAPMDAGAAPYQDVAAVFELRNALIHFKPEWSNARDGQEKLERKLASALARSAFYPASEPLFPFVWATHASTRWAVGSCIELIAHVSTALGQGPELATKLRGLTL
ncbi:MAG: hypothetical protein IT547_04590 [Hyphomonadaceae bacterium]|nr:hypothetical protein [Hyphomonadaceae bacterium]